MCIWTIFATGSLPIKRRAQVSVSSGSYLILSVTTLKTYINLLKLLLVVYRNIQNY